MKIGFDVSQTGSGKAGCGFYAHALAESLVRLGGVEALHFYPSFGDFYLDPQMVAENPYAAPNAIYGPLFKTLKDASGFWNATNLEANLGYPDVVHANNFWCPLGFEKTRLIYTFYDMAFLANPSWSMEANRVGCFDGIFRAASVADWVVAISKASKDHFLSVFPHFPEERVRVIYPCSRFSDGGVVGARPKALEGVESEKFWLCVGTIEPRKNQLGLARAYARYREQSKNPLPLVFAGGSGWLMDHFDRELESLGILGDTLRTGYVTDAELIWLYRNCFANLYPSFFEGFGLPVLEAMQFGAPTMASQSTSLPEVLSSAGLLIPPEDNEAWTRAMLDLEQNSGMRLEMRAAGNRQAANFQWERSTQSLVALYEEALASPKR